MLIRLEPALHGGPTGSLDLAIAIAALAGDGRMTPRHTWILAVGRLGLDGTVHAAGLDERPSLAQIVHSLCHRDELFFEQVFEEEGRG